MRFDQWLTELACDEKEGRIRQLEEGEELLAELGRIYAVATFPDGFCDDKERGGISLHF